MGCWLSFSSQFSVLRFSVLVRMEIAACRSTDRPIFGCGLGCEVRVIFGREGEGNCTSEMKAGQFSIFGAVEENVGRGFSRGFGDRTPSSIYPANPLGALGFCLRE